MRTMNEQSKIVAFLAANGFDESHLVALQKKFREEGLRMHIISPDTGLIAGMDGTNWGHNHMVDAPLNTALGVDYDAVIVAGGASCHAKLRNTAHTQRFVNSVLNSGKPVVALGDSMAMLTEMGIMDDAIVSMDDVSDMNMTQMMDMAEAETAMDVAA